MDNVEVVENHFRNILFPRNHGVVGVTELRPTNYGRCEIPKRSPDARGLLVALGYSPIMEINFEPDAVVLYVGYPRPFRKYNRDLWTEDYDGVLHTLPSGPQERFNSLKTLGLDRVDAVHCHTRFDLLDPDSLNLAEFVIQTTITRMKGLVCQKGGRLRLRGDAFFTDLIRLATASYGLKVRNPKRG